MKKSELRTLYLERRRSLSPEQLAEASLKIADGLFESLVLQAVRYLHCFIPIQELHEIDTSAIFRRMWQRNSNIVTVAPKVNFESGEIESVPYLSGSELAENKWGIQEPIGPDRIDDSLVDVVLVPLLCFDERGYRVGYGRGYYDRFLARCRSDCRRVGLCCFAPVKEIEDVAGHDIALDLFITPEGSFQPKRT